MNFDETDERIATIGGAICAALNQNKATIIEGITAFTYIETSGALSKGLDIEDYREILASKLVFFKKSYEELKLLSKEGE